MSKMAMPSAWSAVTTATRSAKVSSAHAITSWGSRSSRSIAISPISRSSKLTVCDTIAWSPFLSLTSPCRSVRIRPKRRSAPPAGEGGEDGELLPGCDRCVEASQCTDVLFADEHVDRRDDLAVLAEDLACQLGMTTPELVEDAPDRGRVDLDQVGATGCREQHARDAHERSLRRFLGLAGGATTGLPGADGPQVVVAVGGKEVLEREGVFVAGPVMDPGPDEPADHLDDLVLGDPAQQRHPDGSPTAQAAPHPQVVRLGALAGDGVGRGGALQADVPHPVVGARVRAPVHVDAQLLDRAFPEAAFELGKDLFELALGLRHRVVAELVVGAGHRSGVELAAVRFEPDALEPLGEPGHLGTGDVGDDHVLGAGEASLPAELPEELPERDQLVAPHPAHRDRHADID